MFSSPYSSNVILAKARAMYGKSLKPADYAALLNCHSVSEVASYLKNNTAYTVVLSEINEATVHRGHLELLLHRKLFDDYAALARYGVTVGMSTSGYLIQRTEIELIVSCLRLMKAGRPHEFFFSIPLFFSSHTHLDLVGMSRSETYPALLDAMKGAVYHDILERFSPAQNGEIPLTEIETALYTRLVQTMYDIISRRRDTARTELINLYGTHVDMQNVTRILRLKTFFGTPPDEIRPNMLPYGNSIPAKAMEDMIRAPDADSVLAILLATRAGRRIPKPHRLFTYDLHHRAAYFNARRHIHYSIHPEVVMLSYILIMDVELDDIVNIIEGVRYGLQPEEIKPMLVLAGD